MTLSEKLHELEPDREICIGAKCGFLFFGTPSEFLVKADSLNNGLIEKLKITLVAYEKKSGLSSYKKGVLYEQLKKNIKNKKQKIKDFVLLENREVKDAYDKVDGTFAIIVEGDEQGVWVKSEYTGEKVKHDPVVYDEGCISLANQIIAEGAKSYMRAYMRVNDKTLSKDVREKAKDIVNREERFFRGGNYSAMCGIDGESMIRTLQRKAPEYVKSGG